MPLWTEEQDAVLIRMYAEGCSSSQIAGALGSDFSRNSVIGRRHRLQAAGRIIRREAPALIPGGRPPRQTAPVQAKPPVRELAAPSLPVPKPARVVIAPRLARVASPEAAPTTFGPGVAFVNARACQCQWPLWPDTRIVPLSEKRVCGNPVVPGQPYCTHCRDRAVAGRVGPDGMTPIWKLRIDERAKGRRVRGAA